MLKRLLQLLGGKDHRETTTENQEQEPERETTMRVPNVERAVPPEPKHRE